MPFRITAMGFRGPVAHSVHHYSRA